MSSTSKTRSKHSINGLNLLYHYINIITCPIYKVAVVFELMKLIEYLSKCMFIPLNRTQDKKYLKCK